MTVTDQNTAPVALLILPTGHAQIRGPVDDVSTGLLIVDPEKLTGGDRNPWLSTGHPAGREFRDSKAQYRDANCVQRLL